jgi:uncharacterized protein YdeI (YjbR/CyaY-like superfamily)
MKCAFFENELNSNSELKKALEKLTPFKQKEFWEYMATAKQEKTKIIRLEKIKPLIMEKRGLNDKYR